MTEAAPSYSSGRFDEADHEGGYLSHDDTSLHGTDTESSLTSDEDEEDDDEDVGLQAALAASTSEMEDALREELELQRAIEASKDADQDVKFELDTERAIEISLYQERTLEEMRNIQEERLGHFGAESSSTTSLSSASSVSTVSADGTASRARHHPFLSPPASIIFSADETLPSGFNSLGSIYGDLGSTGTEIGSSAYPLLPDSPSASSMDLQRPDEKDDASYGHEDGHSPTTRRQSLSPPPTPLPSGVRPDVFHHEDAIPFAEVLARAKPQYERDVLPRVMQAIPIQIAGDTEPVNIPVHAEDEHVRESYPQRKVTLRSPSPPSPIASEIGDVPFPEVEPSTKRDPRTYKRSHERAFSTRSAHMTYVSSSTTSSIQGEQLVGGSDDTGPSLFTRLAVPPAVVPQKSPSLEMPSLNFMASNLLADIEPRMSLQLFRTTTRPLFSDQCLCISCGAIFVR